MKRKAFIAITALCLIFIFLLNLVPTSDKLAFNKVERLYNNNEYSQALDDINALILKDSSQAHYFELRGKILYHLQDTLHSQEDFNRFLTFASTDSSKEAHLDHLIYWDMEHGKEDEAKKLLLEKLELFEKGSSKHLFIMRTVAYQALNTFHDTTMSLNVYKEILKEYSEEHEVLNEQGILQSKTGQNWSAIKSFIKATELAPQLHLYHYNLAISYLNIKNKTKAKLYFKKAMDLGNSDACTEYRELTAKTSYSKQYRCCDGSVSYAVGKRGACSHHKGVCSLEHVPYKEYTVNCN